MSWELVAWPRCNLEACQRRPCCASRGASKSEVRRRWLSLCTVWPSHWQISSLSTANLALGKARSRREPNLGCTGAVRPGWCDVLPPPPPKESLHESCRKDRRIDVDWLICSLGHCECNGHIQHKLGQRRLTAGLLSPRGSDFSRKRSNVSYYWLPGCIKARSFTFALHRGKQ
jgi:hypothetical protein